MRSLATAVLLLSAASASADTREDLEFATRLARRGMTDIAQSLLNRMAQASDPALAKAGRYGLAAVTKEQASIARGEFLRALREARAPRQTREAILALFAKALPDVEQFVEGQPNDMDAVNLLASLLREYAEFLVGNEYPPEMAAEQAKLLEENRKEAEKHFEKAAGHYERLVGELRKQLKPDADYDDPVALAVATAQFNRAQMLAAWAGILPAGATFLNRNSAAIEALDEFSAEHYEDLYGALAMLELGKAWVLKGTRLGGVDDVETGINYFNELFTRVQVDPAEPATGRVVGEAIFAFAEAGNVLARGAGKIKANPVYYDRVKGLANEIDSRMKSEARSYWAARARLEVAEAFAATGGFDRAVSLAGDALAAARAEGFGSIVRDATQRLTRWVGNVGSAGSLDPGLLLQIGESLAAQDRVASAVTFFEKAIAAARGEDAERIAAAARLRMAQAFRKDRRPFAAARVAMAVVDSFLAKAGADESSPLGQIAGDACDLARNALRDVSSQSKQASDDQEFQRVGAIFREKFPGHPANSDAAYQQAMYLWTNGDFAAAAESFRQIAPSSRNYWSAQWHVPASLVEVARKEKDAEKAKAAWPAVAEAAREVVAAAEKAGDDPKAKSARQYAHFYRALALHETAQWKEALASIDDYLARYPEPFAQAGKEFDLKLQAHLALGELAAAEAALEALKTKVPGSRYFPKCNFDVFQALRAAYEKLPDGEERSAIARRAAKLWEARLGDQAQANTVGYFTYGKVLEAAGLWEEAADAYESAARTAEEDPKYRENAIQFKRLAAKMNFKAALTLKNDASRRAEYLNILNDTWPLFTDVLIEDKAAQPEIVKALGDWQKYPTRPQFDKIKKNPEMLLTTAEVYVETQPHGADGRWAAIRLCNVLQGLVPPTPNPNKPGSEELVPFYWGAAELKVRAYADIARTSTGQDGRQAAKDGLAFVTKITFEFPTLDGEERLKRILAYKAELERRK